jgi:hypothetical protein
MSNQSISVERDQTTRKACVDLKRSETNVTGSLHRANCRHKSVIFLLAFVVAACGGANGEKDVKMFEC